MIANEREKRRKKKKLEKVENSTASVYQEIITQMGDRYYKGYSTSEDDSDHEDFI